MQLMFLLVFDEFTVFFNVLRFVFFLLIEH